MLQKSSPPGKLLYRGSHSTEEKTIENWGGGIYVQRLIQKQKTEISMEIKSTAIPNTSTGEASCRQIDDGNQNTTPDIPVQT
jgi:hypothetical protein